MTSRVITACINKQTWICNFLATTYAITSETMFAKNLFPHFSFHHPHFPFLPSHSTFACSHLPQPRPQDHLPGDEVAFPPLSPSSLFSYFPSFPPFFLQFFLYVFCFITYRQQCWMEKLVNQSFVLILRVLSW